jgi:hypothetical protein
MENCFFYISRMYEFLHRLGHDRSFADVGSMLIGSALSMAQIDDFVSDSDGLRLMRAFMRIDNATLRRRIATRRSMRHRAERDR